MEDMRAGDRDGDRIESDPALDERPPEIGSDERRMHVRAYNNWVSLLGDRAYPSIADLDPAGSADFGAHAVLLDFTAGDDPAIAFLGDRLRRECGIDTSIRSLAEVPAGSLLSRLTGQYRDALANRAPIGFEAEFVDRQGETMLYRGILMPFSSDDERIDHVLGVVNWKALADPGEAERLAAAAHAAMARPTTPPPAADAPVRADEPGAAEELRATPPGTLADRVAIARVGARRAGHALAGARAALHHALGLAHDLLVETAGDPREMAALLVAAGTDPHPDPRALVALLFGDTLEPDYARDCVDALAHATRVGVPKGGFPAYADGLRGGIRAMIAAERA